MRNYKELKVWERAHQLTLTIYELTNNFPTEEKFGITSQIRRAAVSIPTNIAEGCGHNSDKEFRRFLGFSLASATEVEYLITLSFDLEYCPTDKYNKLQSEVEEIKKMLYGFITSLSKKI